MERNPYGARYRALALNELEIGMKVVIIGGGLYYHDHATIASMPYESTGPGIDPHRIGKTIQVTRWLIQVTEDGSPLRESAHPDWLKDMNARYRNESRERSLVDMGLVPDSDGRWSLKYTVRLSDYEPQGLHS